MKYWYIGAGLLILAAGALLWAKRPKPGPQIDGGVRHLEDSGAPKVIQSTEILSFTCEFSALDRCREDTPLAGKIVTLVATREAASFCLHTRAEVLEEGSFRPDGEFFRQLQQLVARYDLAQHNGRHYTVSGLPPGFGIRLEVVYASGETIRASNNQSCFLPLAAMEELTALFTENS